ncbi:MAG: extracellular solute-binding protein [Oscillospiraceae bacterium]|nr:extracellular solute-binding protein [Oscillospiraceae bacterium]
MKMKKMAALLLALAMLLALAACGGNNAAQDSSDPGTSGTPGTDSGTQTPAQTPESGTIELSYWYAMDGVGGQIIEKQIDAFNQTTGAEKGIHVTGVYQDWPGTNALTAAMTTDDTENMPDVIHMFSEYVNLIQDWERTVWAEDYITASGAAVSKDDLIPNTVEAYSIGGKMIGVPYAISALLLYYNQDQLTQAGFDAPPATIDEMARMLPALKEKTGAEYGLNVRLDQFEFENFIVTQGAAGTYFGNNQSGHAGQMTELSSQEAIQAFLTEWEKVIASGAYKETKDSMNEEFAQGLNSMCIMSSARIPTINDLVGDSFQWGVAAIPKVSASDVGGAYPSGSGLFMIDRGEPARVEAAWEFVQYLISADTQAMWLDGCGYVPINVHAEEAETYQSAISTEPRLSVPFDILKNTPGSVVSSFCPDNQTVNTVIQDSMLNFAGGSASKEETYAAITDGIADAFADYFRANPID